MIGPVPSSLVEELRRVLPVRVQKATVRDRGWLALEVYGGETKRWLVVDEGRVGLLTEKPAGGGEAPPAAQGLVRKEIVPSAIHEVNEDGVLLRIVFQRPEGRPRQLVVERDADDPRAVLVADTEDGTRILAVLGNARAKDERDLRRGRIYEAPRNPVMLSAALRPQRQADPKLAEAKAKLKAESKRLRRLIEALKKDLERHGDARRHEEEGELLKTAMGQIKRGMSSVDVLDFNGDKRTIELDATLDAKGNLERRFKKARRAREAIARARPRLAEAEQELARVEELRANPQPVDVEVGGSPRRKAAKAGKRMPWRSFKCTSGVVVRVGRGARDNDSLVKSARGNDLWLHAREAVGGHVIAPVAEIDSELLLDAAHLAAHFSSMRGEARVDVQYTRVKHLRKASAPGLWLVSNESVIHVRIDDERVKRLLAAEVPA